MVRRGFSVTQRHSEENLQHRLQGFLRKNQQQQEEGSAGFELPVNLPTGFADLPLLNDRMTTTTSIRTATSSTTTAKVSVVDKTEEEKVFDEIPLDNIDPDFEDFDFELPGSTTQKSGTYNFFFRFYC